MGICAGLEKEFQCQLTDARVSGLSGPEGSESARAELLEVRYARLRTCTGGNFLVKEVHAVENIEELRTEL